MNTNPTKISVVITNFNTWNLVQESIAALELHAPAECNEVIIVDDASAEAAPAHYTERVRVIRNPVNQGYVRSVNIGVRAAKNDIILLMDSDAYLLSNILPPILEHFQKDSRLGALGVCLVDKLGKPMGACHPDPNCLELLLGTHLTNVYWKVLKHREMADPCIYSCFIAFRKEAFLSVGGFDEKFDFLEADVDFSISIRKAGWHVKQDAGLKAFHQSKGSPQSAARRLFQLQKNQWLLLKKHKRLPPSWLAKPILFMRYLTEYLLLGCVLVASLFKKDRLFYDKINVRMKMMGAVWSGFGNDAA